MRIFFPNQTIRHFLKLYLIVFVCLSLAMSLICMSFVRNTHSDTVKVVTEQLKDGLKRMDDEIALLLGTASNFSTRLDFGVFANSTLPYKTQSTYDVKKLIYNFTNSFILQRLAEDYGIITKNGAVLCNNQLHNSMEEYYGSFLKDDDFSDAVQWYESLSELARQHRMRVARIRNSTMTYNAVVLALELSGGYAKSSSVFYACLSSEKIRYLLGMDSLLDALEMSLGDGGVLKIINSPGRASSQQITSASRYGINVSAWINSEMILSSLRAIYHLLLLFVLSHFALGVALAVFFVRRSAKPIIDIVSHTQKESGMPGRPSSDAFSSLRTLIDTLNRDRRNSSVMLKQQQEILRQSKLELLLCNPYEMNRDATINSWFPEFPNPWRIMLFSYNTNTVLSAEEQAMLQGFIRDRLGSRCLIHFQNEYIIFIIGTGMSLEDILSLLADSDLKYIFESGHTAISAEYSDMSQLAKVYTRLRVVLRTLPDNEQTPFIESPFRKQCEAGSASSLQNHKRFSDLIVRNQLNEALELMGKDLRMADLDEHVQLFYNYRNELLLLMNTLTSPCDIELPRYGLDGELQACFEKLREATRLLHAELRSQTMMLYAHGGQEKDILTFLNENYNNPELYIGTVIDRFAITEPQLQDIIRTYTGESFHSFVENKRLELATHLLRKTNEPVARILKSCGYTSTSAFYRAFKLRFGVSPNAYRSQNAEESPSTGA